MSTSKAWHNNLPWGQAPLPAFRLGKAIWHEEYAPKRQSNHRVQPLLPFPGVPQIDQAMHLLHTCQWSRWVPCRLASCWFGLCEFPWTLYFGFSSDIPGPVDSHNPSPLFSAGLPELASVFDYRSLNLPPSITALCWQRRKSPSQGMTHLGYAFTAARNLSRQPSL